jgi:hypothetical protein
MGMSAVRHAGVLLLAAAMSAGLVACSEKPQRTVSRDEGAYNAVIGGPLAERMRNQGESERIAY